MSFKSYALHPQPEHTLVLQDPQPLIFSGLHGLMARFVQSNPSRASQPWKLCPGELHSLAFPDTLVRDRAIFFEQVAEKGLELQWLQSVLGISGQRTEMMFSFAPVTLVHAGPPIAILRPTADRTYNEGLELEGGVLAPKGTWHWGKPHLALGGVVLQPARARSLRPKAPNAVLDVAGKDMSPGNGVVGCACGRKETAPLPAVEDQDETLLVHG